MKLAKITRATHRIVGLTILTLIILKVIATLLTDKSQMVEQIINITGLIMLLTGGLLYFLPKPEAQIEKK